MPSDALARGVKCTGGLLGTRLLFLERMLRERSVVIGKSQKSNKSKFVRFPPDLDKGVAAFELCSGS